MIHFFSVTRSCKFLPEVITKVPRVALLADLTNDTSLWCRSPLDSFPRRPCSSQAQHKRIPYSGRTLAHIKKEEQWSYDPTIKYESLRQCAVPRYAYYDGSASDWSYSSDSEIETETMIVEETQTQKDKMLAQAKKEQPFTYDPYINYDLLKQFVYIDSPDSFTSPPSDSETETPAEVEAKTDRFHDPATQKQLFFDNPNIKDFACMSVHPYSSASETEKEEEAQTDEAKIHAGAKDEQMYCFDPSIKYEPLKRQIVPRFAFFDSSSTDWSGSSDSASDDETETMQEEGTQIQKDNILAEELATSHSTNLQSKPAVQDSSFNLVNHGAKSLAEGSMDSHTGDNSD
ncbi:hypothetical protein POM88_051357 [Heracleum sosnowskyi]|uniref:Uncharacterized protein n=1 Tax=Heracleum sosnowskyi TaxID=360622 RepID=A0AAD8H0C0_9APIA|nr:hypothetical protein POM88_051357 [Heracleum sosnowskyi]